jgi:branched-chain amino acid transport system ATP-binding protein
MLLEINDLCVNYGRIQAIRNVGFSVPEGSIVTLIGANGAGKSTTMKTISGLCSVRRGSITFDGRDITSVPAHKRVEYGINQAPEGRGVFTGMTVLENLEMGAYARKNRKETAARDFGRVYELFPRLKERTGQVAGLLSGGEQQMLAIGRALMGQPRLLLLDEPSMGLAPMLIKQIFDIIEEINSQGMTVLLVEQNAQQALRVADHAHILETGEITRSGVGAELARDPSIRAAYLGGDA